MPPVAVPPVAVPPVVDEFTPLECRRALEALRSGVPNREAVAILGCEQPEIERRFDAILAGAAGTSAAPGDRGMLVSGDFGSGKSHLLAHLEHLALAQGFVCSTVAVSKETPFYDLGKVFKSAMENSRIPGHSGRLIEELGQALDPRSDRYGDFFRWADNAAASGLSPMFPAGLLVHERLDDPELNREIEDFWAGDPLRKTRITTGLREIGQLANYSFRAPKAAELPPQRLRFMSELIRAAGYAGWVILLDEIELVAQFSILQRARSYAELARWFGRAPGRPDPGLVVVATVTEDFALEIISPDGTRKDRDYIAPRLADRYQHLSGPAEIGMRILEARGCTAGRAARGRRSCDHRGASAALQHGHTARRRLSFRWPSRGAGYQNRMRYRVRASISEWDLRRLYPDYNPRIEGDEFRYRYEEEAETEEGSDPGDAGADTPTPNSQSPDS